MLKTHPMKVRRGIRKKIFDKRNPHNKFILIIMAIIITLIVLHTDFFSTTTIAILLILKYGIPFIFLLIVKGSLTFKKRRSFRYQQLSIADALVAPNKNSKLLPSP